MADYERVEVANRAELAAWLAANHDKSPPIWLVFGKKAAGDRYLPNDDLVEECLRVGWIDSTALKVDDTRVGRLLAPRRKGSNWSAVNKRRIDKLTAAGLMEAAGIAAVERAQADGSWTRIDHVTEGVEPDDVAAALDAEPAARRFWDESTPSFRGATLIWIATAKRPETRAKRIAAAVSEAAAGRRVNEWIPKEKR